MRRVLVVLFVLVASVVPAAAGSAQESGSRLLLIMDASGSMNRDTGTGVTLLEEAKAALREIVLRIPGDTEVGLRVYGHRASNDDKVAGCVDTELIIPVGVVDRGEMLGAVDDYEARGWTPIGLSLQQAAEDLGPGGGTIILVSDGEDTCAPPDPCEVARGLADEGYVTRIHTVGLFLQDQAAADQLRCIADAGNGTFTDIASVDGILESLTGVVNDAIEGGIESVTVQGALERNLAPVLPWATGPDIYGALALADGTISTGEVRWYAVEVAEDSAQLAAQVNLDWQPSATPDEKLEIRIFDDNGVEVGVPHEVAGVVVDAPQTLRLVDAAEWLGSAPGATPTALAVTDPVTMFPAWEPNEEWFEPTIERFREAGLNGGIYELFKRGRFADPLAPGTYYIAVGWDADRDAESGMQMNVTMYDVDFAENDWRNGRIEPAVRIDDGSRHPFPLDPVQWAGGPLGDGLGTPVRGIEVWSANDGEVEDYSIELAEGEVLAVAHEVWFARMDGNFDPRTTVQVTGAAGEVAPIGFEPFDPPGFGFGFGEILYFRAPAAGVYRILTALGGELGNEPAVATAVLVFPPDADIGPDEEDPAGADDTRLDELARLAWRAVRVAAAASGSG